MQCQQLYRCVPPQIAEGRTTRSASRAFTLGNGSTSISSDKHVGLLPQINFSNFQTLEVDGAHEHVETSASVMGEKTSARDSQTAH